MANIIRASNVECEYESKMRAWHTVTSEDTNLKIFIDGEERRYDYDVDYDYERPDRSNRNLCQQFDSLKFPSGSVHSIMIQLFELCYQEEKPCMNSRRYLTGTHCRRSTTP